MPPFSDLVASEQSKVEEKERNSRESEESKSFISPVKLQEAGSVK
jgi:hypothetical protein